ncbi:hypothetical protein HZA97_07605 [Candidatus Woesearchaeota archaeon]|nr:hypothetical protein [Candidatus Woesearchaeota archaeon]
MHFEKLDKVAESLKKSFTVAASEIILPNKKVPIEKTSFFPINETVSTKKIGFVDGGNGEIIGGVNFSVQLIKIYWSVYQDNKRIKKNLDEFLILVNLKNSEGIFYEVTFFDKKDAFVFEAFENKHLIKPSVIAEKIRKIFEIKACNKLLDCDFIVRDGDLEFDDFDKVHYEELLETCKEKKVVLAGLSKTSTILCDNSQSASVVLSKLAKLSKWYYKCDDNRFFVRMHKKSRYVFRLDISEFSEELIELLAKNSVDLIFPGYPYALIDVDKMARVNKDELERMKLYLLTKYEKDFDQHMASVDMHDKLNLVK